MPLENQPQELNRWQVLASRTHDIVTPSNALDAVSIPLAAYAAPRFDTWGGIGLGLAAYSVDFIDGWLARRLGVASELGSKVDTVGDKIRVGIAVYNIWKNDQAPKSLLGAVAVQNLANAAMTVADRALNDQPEITVTDEARRAMFMQVGGIGLNVIGTKVAENNPLTGRALKISGTAIGFSGLLKYGLPTTRTYFNNFLRGIKKPVDQERQVKAGLHKRV